MKNHDKSPGMCSDCPRITPKILNLEVFPTCLREKERESFWRECLGLVRGEKEIAQYKPSLVGPIFLSSGGPSATSMRTVRDEVSLRT
jgi:hypothetical protein